MIVSYLAIGIGVLCLIIELVKDHNIHKILYTNKKDNPSICIIIPARDESKVIAGILDSIQRQTHSINMQDVYTIIESKEDETYNISLNHGAVPLIRTNPSKQRKGYALDEGLKQVVNKKHYDLYFIFDADNILDKNYIKEMLKSYYKGYDLAVGYRNTKNGNDNVIAACSTLTFSMINQLFNDKKKHKHLNVTISGTGFYIKGELIDKWNGYPFNSLTEDYELTLYCILHNLNVDYNHNAIFYDEQPTKLAISIEQRTRWVKGYFEARQKYIPLIKDDLHHSKLNKVSKTNEIYIIRYIILIVAGYLLNLFINIYNMVFNIIIKDYYLNYVINIIVLLLLLYCILMSLTIKIISKEKKILNLNTKSKIIAVFTNPFFLITYLNCLYKAMTNKNIKWSKIEHNINKLD